MAAVKTNHAIRFSPALAEAAGKDGSEVLQSVNTPAEGFSSNEAAARREKYGSYEVTLEKQHGWLWRLGSACKNPLVILLSALAIIAYATGDVRAGTVMVLMVILEQDCDVAREEDESVLLMAYLTSHFQTGLKNVLDRAILEHNELHEHFLVVESDKVDEIPFDFTRRMWASPWTRRWTSPRNLPT